MSIYYTNQVESFSTGPQTYTVGTQGYGAGRVHELVVSGATCNTIYTSRKNHFHEMNGDVGMAEWK